jgi:membrane dipeptidase
MHLLSLHTLANLLGCGGLYATWNLAPQATSTYHQRADALLSKYPVLDGHWDLPIVARFLAGDNLANFTYDDHLWGQVDIPRIRKGGVGGFWSAAYVGCNSSKEGPNFDGPTDEVRDTLEQIDLTRQLAAYFPRDVALATTPAEHRRNVAEGKVSHWIGIEGAHSLGNSLATLRMYAELGVTYVTVTHYCHNVFADSCSPSEPRHGGLSDFGRRLIVEMNRLGVAADLSHTSADTQRQVIELSAAPIFYSHSGAKSVYNHVRNIEEDVLHSLRDREAVIGIPFVADFVHGSGNSTIEDVLEHIEHIASVIGREKLALGSDYDGSFEFARGLEDVTAYPKLLARLLERGWSDEEVAGLASENFLRVVEKTQQVGRDLRSKGRGKKLLPDMKAWEGRKDREYVDEQVCQ